jgi:ribA/ribD-fused uncharacterized protein
MAETPDQDGLARAAPVTPVPVPDVEALSPEHRPSVVAQKAGPRVLATPSRPKQRPPTTAKQGATVGGKPRAAQGVAHWTDNYSPDALKSAIVVDGVIGPNGYLSQHYVAPFVDAYDETSDGVLVEWKTAEHYFVYHKAKTFGDEESQLFVLKTSTPGQVKSRGRSIPDIDIAVWDKRGPKVAMRGMANKFTEQRNRGLLFKLLATAPSVIVEAREDNMWGIGCKWTLAQNRSPKSWGENRLGLALMNTRRRLLGVINPVINKMDGPSAYIPAPGDSQKSLIGRKTADLDTQRPAKRKLSTIAEEENHVEEESPLAKKSMPPKRPTATSGK